MADAPRESPAPQERRERITDGEVRQALARNAAENRPASPRDVERRDAENSRDFDLFTLAVEMLPREGRLLQKELERSKKRSETPSLIDAQKRAEAVIGAYIQGLKQDLAEGFTETDFRMPSRAFGKNIQRRVQAMLDQAQRDGLVTVYNGRLANRVGYAGAWIKELQQMRASPGLTPKQKNAILAVERFFQDVLRGDSTFASILQARTRRRPDSPAVRNGKKALKMLGVLAMAGMALISGAIDVTRKQLSPYTLGWLGLTAWGAGFFKGQPAIVRDQLCFVPKKDWETLCQKLSLRGKEGVEFIDYIQKAYRKKNGKKAMELLANARESRSLSPAQYIPLLVGENPQGLDAQMETKLKTLTPQELYLLCRRLTLVSDRTANALLRDFIEHDVSSRTVAPDLKKLKSPAPAA